jgi:RNA polymerase sigma factor (sigma-70 family)
MRPPLSCDATELARLVKEGDAAALDRLTRCFGEKLAAVGARACGDRERGRDAVQDALLAAGENLETFRGDGSVEGWLTRMVVNACARMRRGRKNDPALHVIDNALLAPSEEPGERGELADLLNGALLQLAPTDRAIVLLADAEDWESAEIAAHLGMTPGAVRTRLSRSRAKLRGLLA